MHQWEVFEASIQVPHGGRAPFRDLVVVGEFDGPSGTFKVPGFWDGDEVWRVRFSPGGVGPWRYTIRVHAAGPILRTNVAFGGGDRNKATETPLVNVHEGQFICVPYTGTNPLFCRGPVRPSRNGRHLEHADGTPFFWLADTVWNGPMLATANEWEYYVRVRAQQGFTVAQYVSTQWRTAPDGGPDGPAFTTAADGRLATINPPFFRRLDARLAMLARSGLVGAPVLLWAIGGGEGAHMNPGHILSEQDCIDLARYQVARWQAYPVCWILNGDGRYTGESAARWQRIGQAVFAEVAHDRDRAPVATHPGGQQWVGAEFGAEPWLDVIGYQSGHGDDERAWRWITEGPPAAEWRHVHGKAVINLEPCYEDHLAYQSRSRITPEYVRRACYWSLLVTPTAGITYGGHGVWGWDDGSGPPVAHPNTGTAKAWREALFLPAAQHMRHLADCFADISWWTLRPDPSLLRYQPGEGDVLSFVTAARSEDGKLAVFYLPAGNTIQLDLSNLADGLRATWVNPRDGTRATPVALSKPEVTLTAPDAYDWLLVIAT